MDETTQLKERVQLLENLVFAFVYQDRYNLGKFIKIEDGKNIQIGANNGTKIGTSTLSKIGFWNKTPIIQPAHADQAALSITGSIVGSDTVDITILSAHLAEIQTWGNQLRTDLIAVGIIRGSA